jgi:hypothetical protein
LAWMKLSMRFKRSDDSPTASGVLNVLFSPSFTS